MEIRKVKGYEERYAVSDDGRVFSLYDCFGNKQMKEKKQYTDKYGYKCTMLYMNGKRKHMTVHRLVAMAFLENENCLPQINHIDGNKSNNNVNNLEWCTASQNVQHSYDTGLNIPHESPWKGCESKDHPRSKPVLIKKGEISMCFLSSIDACKFLSVSKSAVASAINKGHKVKGWKPNWIAS